MVVAAGRVRWDLVEWGFGYGGVVAAAVVAWIWFYMHHYDNIHPPSGGSSMPPPQLSAVHSGPLAEGKYQYGYTEVRLTLRLAWRPWRIESPMSAATRPHELHTGSIVKVALPATELSNVIERRIYRKAEHDAKFHRVGEVAGGDATEFLDGWAGVRLFSELTSLGTNWSFKDNWIGNLTLGASALVAVFASSSTFGDALGDKGKPALTAIAVAGGVAAVLVALGPLIVKMIGIDLAYTTALGMLLAAFVTLTGTLGQVGAVTLEMWTVTSHAFEHLGLALLGGLVSLVTVLYAWRALWYYLKTGALYSPAARASAKSPGAVAATQGPEQRSALL